MQKAALSYSLLKFLQSLFRGDIFGRRAKRLVGEHLAEGAHGVVLQTELLGDLGATKVGLGRVFLEVRVRT